MKTLLLLFLILPSLILAQSSGNNSILSLKNQINISPLNNIEFQNDMIQPEKKKTGLAILYSLLLPGMGELYADNYNNGVYFTIADGILWGALTGFSIYGNQQESNYRAFAQSHGGVSLEGKDETYFAVIGDYTSIDQYNIEKELYREFDDIYNIQTHYWNWESSEQRKEYREMWGSSESAFNNIRFIVGGLILNRLVSAINAVRLVVAYNKNIEQQVSWNFSMNVINHYTEPGVSINFTTSF